MFKLSYKVFRWTADLKTLEMDILIPYSSYIDFGVQKEYYYRQSMKGKHINMKDKQQESNRDMT